MKKILIILLILNIVVASYGTVNIQSEFSDKIVYTTDSSAEISILQKDCINRGGQFNTCGNICDGSQGGQICPAVCAFTCELDEINKDGFANGENIYTVKRVIDCSTLELTTGEEVRLIGIQCPQDEKMGKEATEFVKSLIKTKNRAFLKLDAQKRDRYGRLLAYMYIDIMMKECNLDVYDTFHIDYTHLNEEIIKCGYAQPASSEPNVTHAELFEELYKEARDNGRGLWKNEYKERKALQKAWHELHK